MPASPAIRLWVAFGAGRLLISVLPAAMNDDRTQILQSIDRFVAAYNAGDVEALLPLYAEDLIKLGHGRAAESKADVAARLRASFEQYNRHLEAGIDEFEIAGDLAYTRGWIRITLTPKSGGAPLRVERRSLEIWRKRAGRWVATRTMDNEGGR